MAGEKCKATEKCFTTLERGKPAPFTGRLFSNPFAIDLTLRADFCDVRVDKAVLLAENLAAIALQKAKDEHAADQETWATKEKLYQDEIDRSNSIWRSPEFVATVSVILTVAAILTATKVMEARGGR